MSDTDQQLLARYLRKSSEDAFAEIVRRHVDLVYTAALRQIRSPQLAEEISQSVFTDLARAAAQLKPDTILTAWLYQVTRRTAIDVVRRESRRQLREQIAVAMTAMNSTASDWTHIEPLLDEAMETLDETDRTAILLRYFENKSLREVGQSLGTSDDTAQKRVSRAVERLREFFAKRGVAIGAGGLVIVISTNAVQAAPIGLSTAISTAATLTGITVAISTTVTATKAIAMTTLQKTLVTATIAILAGAGLYEAHQAAQLRDQVQTISQQQRPLAEQIQQFQSERDDATNRLALLQAEVARLKSGESKAELAKLRSAVGNLKDQLDSTKASSSNGNGLSKMMSDPAMKEYIHQAQLHLIKQRYAAFFQEMNLTPEQSEKFTQLLGDAYLKGTERFSALAQGKTNPSDLEQSTDHDKATTGNAMRALLGDAGSARLEQFNQEIPARTTVSLLNTQLGNNPLNADQSTQLLKLVKSEPFDLTHGISGDFDKAFMGSPGEIESYLQKIRESNQRVAEQAASFLTPEQLAGLNLVLSNGITARTTQAAAFSQKH